MITRWSDLDRVFNAIDAMGLLRGRLESGLDEFDQVLKKSGSVTGTTPRTNLFDMGEYFELSAEVPGIGKDDLSVKIQGNYLEITGTRSIEAPAGYTTHRNERSSLNFTRSLTLPADVDSAKVEARLQHGVLVLSLPKAEPAKPQEISIS
jgi:HSP20 family protein